MRDFCYTGRMRLVLLLCLLFPAAAFAQADDPLAVTLPTGKVVHFQTTEQKAKYLAARDRSATIVVAQPSATPASDPWLLNKASATGPHPYFTFDAVTAGSSGDTQYTWQTDYGSYIANRTTAKHVSIKVGNSGGAPGAVRVRWFFYTDAAGNYMVAGGQRDLILQHNQQVSWDPAKAGVEHIENYAALGESGREGSQVTAWLVQFYTVPGTPAKQIGSSGIIEQKAGDTEKFAKQVAQFEAANGKLKEDW